MSILQPDEARLQSAVGNVYVSDCRSRDRDFNPDQVPYFRVD